MPRELPGFFWDEAKQRYFRIAHASAPAGSAAAQHNLSNVKKKRRVAREDSRRLRSAPRLSSNALLAKDQTKMRGGLSAGTPSNALICRSIGAQAASTTRRRLAMTVFCDLARSVFCNARPCNENTIGAPLCLIDGGRYIAGFSPNKCVLRPGCENDYTKPSGDSYDVSEVIASVRDVPEQLVEMSSVMTRSSGVDWLSTQTVGMTVVSASPISCRRHGSLRAKIEPSSLPVCSHKSTGIQYEDPDIPCGYASISTAIISAFAPSLSERGVVDSGELNATVVYTHHHDLGRSFHTRPIGAQCEIVNFVDDSQRTTRICVYNSIMVDDQESCIVAGGFIPAEIRHMHRNACPTGRSDKGVLCIRDSNTTKTTHRFHDTPENKIVTALTSLGAGCIAVGFRDGSVYRGDLRERHGPSAFSDRTPIFKHNGRVCALKSPDHDAALYMHPLECPSRRSAIPANLLVCKSMGDSMQLWDLRMLKLPLIRYRHYRNSTHPTNNVLEFVNTHRYHHDTYDRTSSRQAGKSPHLFGSMAAFSGGGSSQMAILTEVEQKASIGFHSFDGLAYAELPLDTLPEDSFCRTKQNDPTVSSIKVSQGNRIYTSHDWYHAAWQLPGWMNAGTHPPFTL
ncbi:hypothetical protein PYCC9005_003156 [Savitreella phatthalungensis]